MDSESSMQSGYFPFLTSSWQCGAVAQVMNKGNPHMDG